MRDVMKSVPHKSAKSSMTWRTLTESFSSWIFNNSRRDSPSWEVFVSKRNLLLMRKEKQSLQLLLLLLLLFSSSNRKNLLLIRTYSIQATFTESTLRRSLRSWRTKEMKVLRKLSSCYSNSSRRRLLDQNSYNIHRRRAILL